MLTSTFRKKNGVDFGWVHYVLCYCRAIAMAEPRYCPVLTRLPSDTGKFSHVVLRYVSLPPHCSLATATLSNVVPCCASLLPCDSLVSVWGYINLVTSDTRLILAHNCALSYRFLLRPSHVVRRHVTLWLRWRYVDDVRVTLPYVAAAS